MKSEVPDDVVELPWACKTPTLLISTSIDLRLWMHTCWNSQTLEAYSETHRCTVWIPLPCKKWSCRYCAQIKVNDLARRTEKAKPNRLLTLTVDTKLWDDPRAAFDGTRRQVSELARKVRKDYSEFEYLRVTELTRGGWPHYHLLVRSPYLPQPKIKSIWKGLTGATIVDLRKVQNKLDTFFYLVKYLSKLHTIDWTERHVSYTKSFFPPKGKKQESKLGLQEGKVIEAHPADLLAAQYRHATLAQIAFGVFTLERAEGFPELETCPAWAKEPDEEEESCSNKVKKTGSASSSQKTFQGFEQGSLGSSL